MNDLFNHQRGYQVIKQKELKEDKKIGEGSFGIVYLGTFRENQVAIKKIKEMNEDKMKEFEKEVSMLDKFRIEYIVHFYGAVFIPNKMCIVTEFAQFGSLQDLMNNQNETNVPMKLKIKMMIDAGKGIQYLHSNGILHRNIKPGTILIVSLDDNENVNAKLNNFGTSRKLDLSQEDLHLTMDVGTPTYMSPEILQNDSYDWKVDVFSFAITMYECFGWCECYPKPEFKFIWDIARFVSDGNRRPKPYKMTNEQYQLIEQCWKQNPKERMEIKEVVKALETFLEENKRKEEEENRRIISIIENKEIQQIEEWTGMKKGYVIFDSSIDNWNINTSVFGERILNKSNLIFIIEDEDDNKFGGYINSKIDKIDSWISDPKSFLFSLKSNGRLNGMLKFDIKDPSFSFVLYNKSDNNLFEIGGGFEHFIFIYKENMKNESYCKQITFNYNGNENVLCGKEMFTPTRITVIQLI